MTSPPKVLPNGWKWIQLEEIAEITLGQSPPSSTYNSMGKGLPFYQGKLEFGKIYPTPTKWCTSPNKIAEQGDVLISVRAPVGPTNICPEKSCIGRGLAAIHPLDGISSFFILYLIRAFEKELSGKGTGTTFKAIRGNQLRSFDIPLPPLDEQSRIVCKLEELFTRLDAGIESLRNVKAQLQLYRQTVLKHAFNGKLTEEWRKTHKYTNETGQRFLQKIRQQRRQGWEENLRVLDRDPQKFKYKEPLLPSEITNLPSLPIEWTYASADELSVQITDGEHVTPKRQKEGIYLLSARNVLDGRLVLDDIDYISESEYDRIKRRVKPESGDVLLTCSGSVGRSCVVPKGLKFQMVRSVAIIKPLKEFVNGKFLSYALMSNNLQSQINRKKTQTAQSNIFQGKIKRLAFPLAPLPEQLEIVEKVENYFSVADIIEKNIGQSLLRSAVMRQSILKTAFEGRLVPQNPSDEPAEKLLERIRKKKHSNQKQRTKRRKKSEKNQRRLDGYVE
jgi:type I restriction enzyme S subunit